MTLSLDHMIDFSLEAGGVLGSGISVQAKTIIKEIIYAIKKHNPKTMSTVDAILKQLKTGDQASFYGLIVGEIQSGKTPAQMFLIWMWCRVFMGHVCFITKSLDAIRRDMMGKFTGNPETHIINKHIIEICSKYGYSKEEALEAFGLTYHIYTDHTQKKLGKAGQVEIILMQKDNFDHVRRWYHENTSVPRRAPTLFIIDEIHEMYAGAEALLEHNGLENAKKISNIGMLHWIHSKMLLKKCFLIGVTATPFAPMSGDPVCWPTQVFRLDADPPAPSLTYYGYGETELKNISIEIYKDEISTVEKVLARPRNTLKNLKREVPLICITSKTRNGDQRDIKTALEKKFKDRVNVLCFNQENFTPLSTYFNKGLLTETICKSGAVVIIGRACMAAGITIKPSKNIDQMYDSEIYTLSGITDQIMPDNDINVTSTKQLMRLLGWFPDGHQSVLWLAKEALVPVYMTEIADVSGQFFRNYDGNLGPESVQTVSLQSKYIKSFYANDFYRVSEKLSQHVKSTTTVPVDNAGEELEILHTSRIKLTLTELQLLSDLKFNDRTIASFYNKGVEQRKLRKILAYDSVDFSQIPYDQCRMLEIMKAAISPKSFETEWHVKRFLWGPNGVESKIQDCYTVEFADSPAARATENCCFERASGEWISVVSLKTKGHTKLDLFKTLSNHVDGHSNGFNHEHHEVLDTLDLLAESVKEKPLKAWSIFLQCHKIEFKTSCLKVCSEKYKGYKDGFKTIAESNTSLNVKLELGCKLINPYAIESKPTRKLVVRFKKFNQVKL